MPKWLRSPRRQMISTLHLVASMGLRLFAGSQGGHAFMRLVERLSALSTPAVGSTKIQIEVAAAVWRSKFAEMVR
jgi:hypothetical protein